MLKRKLINKLSKIIAFLKAIFKVKIVQMRF